MKKQFASFALSGLLAAGMTCGMAFAQDQGSGTMNSNAQGSAGTNAQSTMGSGQQGSMGQGSMDQGSMQAGTGTMNGKHHGMGGGMNADQRLAHMTKKYNLTADQQSQIKPILQDEQQQMMSMHSDSSMSKQDKMSKMQSMHQDDNQKIEAVLNDNQKKMYEADQQKMMQKHMNKMKGDNGTMSGNGSMASCHPQQ